MLQLVPQAAEQRMIPIPIGRPQALADNVGDKINVYVADVNVSKQKVAFSVKEYKQKLQRDEISQYMSTSNSNEDEAYTPFGDLLKNKN